MEFDANKLSEFRENQRTQFLSTQFDSYLEKFKEAEELANTDPEMAEMALAHAVGNRVEQAYRRGDLLEKRFRLMRDWAEYVSREPRAGDVIAIRGGAGNGD